jgi:hypothetical protein
MTRNQRFQFNYNLEGYYACSKRFEAEFCSQVSLRSGGIVIANYCAQ